MSLEKIKELFLAGKFTEMDELIKSSIGSITEPEKLIGEAQKALEVPGSSGYPFVAGRSYRIHFKNGNSGEYDGAALAAQFTLDPEQIETVDLIPLIASGE